MASLAAINIVFRADLKGYSSELQNAKRQLEKSGQQFQDIGKKMSLAVSLPLLALGGAAVKFGSDYQESLNKADVAFKDTSNEVRNFAKTTLDGFGIAEGSALDMAAQFGDMSTSMGLTTARASAMSTSLVGLAGDLASFKNIGIDQAQTALNGIFTGETESLKMLGIVMTEANLQQFAYSKGIKAKIKDMTQAEKVELRYAYVMAQTTNAQGDFTRTGGGAANQMRIVQESLKQLAADIGQIILPAFTKMVVAVNGIIKGFSNLEPSTKKMIVITAGLIAVTGPLITAYGYVLSLIPKIATQFAVLRSSVIGVRLAQLAATVQTLALSAAQNLAMAGSQLFAAAQMALTGNIIGATQAMNVFKASMAATPWGLVATAIGVAAIAYAVYTSEVKKLTFEQIQQAKMRKLESDLQSQATQIITTQRTALEGLIYTAKNKYLSDKERMAAIKEINALSPKYLGNITLEGIETDKTTKAVEAYTAALLKGAMARAAQGKLDELYKKQIDNEFQALKAKTEVLKTEKEWKKNLSDNSLLQKERNQLMKDEPLLSKLAAKQKKEGFDVEVDYLQKLISENQQYLKLLESIGSAQSNATGPKAGTIEYYEALIASQKKIQTTLSVSNDSFAIAQGKIEEYQKAIDKISGKRPELVPVAMQANGISGSVKDLESQIAKIRTLQNEYATTSTQFKMYEAEINALEFKIKVISDDAGMSASLENLKTFTTEAEIIQKQYVANAGEFNRQFGEVMKSATNDLIGSFGEIIGQFAAGSAGLQDVGSMFLTTLADVAINIGKMVIGIGVATLALNTALKSLNPYVALAAGAALVVLGSLAKSSIKKSAGPQAFANGGIVGGTSYYGDKILARVNSGELILNQNQQKNLFGMINPAVTAQDMVVQLMGGFELDGSKLRLVLDRTDAKNNRIK